MMSSTSNGVGPPPEQMSVGELREWLKNFGKKNEEHFRQGQMKPRRRSPVKIPSAISGTNRVSNRRTLFEQPNNDHPNDDDDKEEENSSQQENHQPGSIKPLPPPPRDQPLPRTHSERVHNKNTMKDNPSSQCAVSLSTNEGSFNLQPKLELSPVKASPSPPKQVSSYKKSIGDGTGSPNEDESSVTAEVAEQQESSELPEAPSLEELCLTFSNVSMISKNASFSMEVDHSGKSLLVDESLEEEKDAPFLEEKQGRGSNPPPPQQKQKSELLGVSVHKKQSPTKTTHQVDYGPSRFQQPKLGKQGQKKAVTALQQLKVRQSRQLMNERLLSASNQHQPRAVPAAWSDLEPLDFSCSDDSSSNEKGDELDRPWQIWDSGDDQQYLQRQALPAFQGYWSDNECDNGSVATAPSGRLHSKNPLYGGRHRHRRNSLSRLETTTIFEEEPAETGAAFSLFGAARASMVGHDDLSVSRSLSWSDNYFVVSTQPSKSKGSDDPATNQSMHNANLFHNKTLTAGALDAICGTSGQGSTGRNKQERNGGNLGHFLENGGEQGTICSLSEDSREPSIAPNAVDANLSKVLSHDTENTYPTVDSYEQRQPSPTRLQSPSSDSDFRQELPSLASDDSKSKLSVSSSVVDAAPNALKEKVAERAASPSSASSSFSAVIQKFGGGGRRSRKTRIERQTEALEQKWQANRKVKHIKKTKWQVCRTSGIYKKRICLDTEEK